MIFDAFFLPGLSEDELLFEERTVGELRIRTPILNATQLSGILDHLKEARAHLAAIPVGRIVDRIDGAVAELLNERTELGRAAFELLPLATGYSAETVRTVLTRVARDWSADSLEQLLVSELGDPHVIDEPTPNDAGSIIFATGPRLAFHIFSGNVPGVNVTSLIRTLLVKAPSLGKTASGEPVLAVLFAKALERVAPEVANALAVTYWPGGTEDLEAVALNAADTVIVYGGSETVDAVKRRTNSDTRLLVHGPKHSFGIVGRRAELSVARAIAQAAAAYDQQGCVSPHAVFVEANGRVNARDLAQAIAHEFEVLRDTLPRRKVSAGEALAIREARTRAEFSEIAGNDVATFASEDTSYTVVYDAKPQLTASCLNRTLYIHPIENIETLPELLRDKRDVLQSVAIAGFGNDEISSIVRILADAGATRVTTFEQLPWPQMTWHHDGRGPLLELLTWHDLET